MIPAQIIKIVALDQTKKAFKSVGGGLKSVTKAIFSMKAGLALLAGAAGFGYLIKKNLDAIDVLAKTASRIGTTTDALSKLRHAGELSGVSTESLSNSMQRLIRNVAEASKGTGEAKDAIKQLGLSATQFNKIPLDQKMLILADKFSEVTDQSEQLRLAFKLFGREGTAIVNMLKGGSAGLQAMYDDAELLGLVMENKSAKGVEAANDAMTRLFSIGKGLAAQFTAAIAPAIKLVADKMTDLSINSIDGYGTFKDFGEYLAKEFLLTIANVIDIIGRMGNAFLTTFDYIMTGMDKLAGKRTARVIQSEIDELNKALNDSKNADGLFENIISAGDRLRVSFNGFEFFSEEDLQAKIQALNTELDGFDGVQSNIDLSGIVAHIRALAGAVGSVSSEMDTGGDGLTTKTSELQSAFENLKGIELGEIYDSGVKQAFSGITQAFTDGITGAKKFGDAFKDMAKGIVDSLIKMMVQYMIVQPIFDAIGTKMGFDMKSMGSTNSKSYGGTVSAGQPTIVGERGREMFIPNSNGAIVSSDNLGGGAGVVINQTINLSTGVAQTVKAEVMNMMPQIASRTKQAVLDSRQRGGAYGRNLVGA
jgi:hypothetical protein